MHQSHPASILVVEDDHATRYLCDTVLRGEGHSVATAADGKSALYALRGNRFDLVVLDLNLPDMDGLELARAMNERAGPALLMMTMRTAPEERVAGFEHGALDYLHKPFHPTELVHRVRRVLTQPVGESRWETSAGRWRLSIAGRELVINEEHRIKLTAGETDMLDVLMRAHGRPVSRDRLLDAMSGAYAGNHRSVDVLIARLRRKIEHTPADPRHLLTVQGIGYRLVLADAR